MLAHVDEVGDYFQAQLARAGQEARLHCGCAWQGTDARRRSWIRPIWRSMTVAEMLKRRIVINCTSDTVLRFLPPYILEREHVDTAIEALDKIFTEHTAAYVAHSLPHR